MEWNDHKGMKMNGFRSSPSEVQNVPNAKYLAIWHTKHQKPLLSDVSNLIKFATCEQYHGTDEEWYMG